MDTAGTDVMPLTAVDLLTVDRRGPDGVVWSLARGGDLDANLVHLAPGRTVDAHVNDEVDVLLVGISGSGSVTVNRQRHDLRAGSVVAVPKQTERSISAGPNDEITYMTVHLARAGLDIGRSIERTGGRTAQSLGP